VARRRYRTGGPYSSAANPRPDEPAPAGQLPLSDAETSSPQPPKTDEAKAESEPSQHFSSGLKEQLAQQRAYASDPLEQYITFHFPGALPAERAWLRANQHHLANPALIHSAAQMALQRGCPRGSPEFMQFCGALLDQHAAAQGHAAPPPAPPPPEPEPQHVIDLEAEHSDSAEPEESPVPQHFSAPVSRGGDRYAVEPEPTMGSIRLSAEQRDMAHRSMPHLSADEAEKSYAANLIKMQKMQMSGLLK